MKRILITLSIGLLAAACGGTAPTEEAPRSGDGAMSGSTLVLNGKAVGDQSAGSMRVKPTDKAAKNPRRTRTARKPIPAPPLLTDGSIDDGPDPFLNDFVQVQPIPTEDDASTTAAIDMWSKDLRHVEREQWDRWMASGTQNPWGQTDDPVFASLVKINVERCGGGRSVASGVVLADETVVTTVHAIQSASRRIRVAPALGDTRRLAAMIRYLDVDDDIAVLKVPGLVAPSLGVFQPSGAEPRWGYAYGVGRGSRSGSVRRVPAIVTTRTTSLTLEQPDGLGKKITDRPVQTMVAGVDTGSSGGIVTATDDPNLVTGFGFHGIVRARVPFRTNTGGIVVPSNIVRAAITAAQRNEQWFEVKPGNCPQWHR
ncbi:MAG: trypsin-like peptidase domain-containing protein [Gaiellales bacterium]